MLEIERIIFAFGVGILLATISVATANLFRKTNYKNSWVVFCGCAVSYVLGIFTLWLWS